MKSKEQLEESLRELQFEYQEALKEYENHKEDMHYKTYLADLLDDIVFVKEQLKQYN